MKVWGSDLRRYGRVVIAAPSQKALVDALNAGPIERHGAAADPAPEDGGRLRTDPGACAVTERRFPIQANPRQRVAPTDIPWAVAEVAYREYVARWGASQSLERLAERGGFHPEELTELLAGSPAKEDES